MTQKNRKEKKSMLGQVVHALRHEGEEGTSPQTEHSSTESVSDAETEPLTEQSDQSQNSDLNNTLPTAEPALPKKETPASQPKEELVGLCIKVPKSMRQKWKLGAAREGITVTDAIIEALNERFQ